MSITLLELKTKKTCSVKFNHFQEKKKKKLELPFFERLVSMFLWCEKLVLNIVRGKVMTDVFIGKSTIFEILFYWCRKFLQLPVQNEFTTRI